MRISSSFFETAGWQSDKSHYLCNFDPAKNWVSKKRGELRLKWEGDERGSKTTIAVLLQHGLQVLDSFHNVFQETESSAPSSPDSESILVSELGTASVRSRAAAVSAKLAMKDLSTSPSSASDSSFSPPLKRTRSTSSSLISSPNADQQAQTTPAAAAPTMSTAAPQRSTVIAQRSAPAPASNPEHFVDSSDEEEEQLAMDRVDYSKVYTKYTRDNTQPVNTIDWKVVNHLAIKEDLRERVPGVKGTKYPALLLNLKDSSPEMMEIYDYYKHLLPPSWLSRMAVIANKELQDDPANPNYRKTSAAELECVFGLALAASVHGSGPFDTYFSNAPLDDAGMFAGPGFGRFGINKNRALVLLRCAHLSDGPQQPAGEGPHWFIDPVIDEFNVHMKTHFKPSYLGCADESGPPWHGREEEADYNACPHTSFVPRKPEPLCAEFNTVGCALSRILNKLEFEKAAKYHSSTKHFAAVGSYNAAMTVRLAEPWANQNGLIYGDSRFGSVKAAYFNKVINDVDSIFDIKTAHSLFPKKELARLVPKKHGAVIVMQATITEGLPQGKPLTLYAIGQRRGPAVHTFLSTCGSFIKEVPLRFPKCSLLDAPWLTPAVLNTVTKAQPTIDVLNRTIFEQLGMHDTFVTRCFETRFVQHTMMPITYVNAVNAAKYFNPKGYPATLMPKYLLLKLASKMVTNPGWIAINNRPLYGPGGGGAAASTRAGTTYSAGLCAAHVSINGGPPSRESPCKHVLIPLKEIPGYRGHKQQRCYECNQLCSWACARCSTKDLVIALHPQVTQGTKNRYGCLAAHRKNPTGAGYRAHHEEISGTSKISKRRRRLDLVHL